jgi:signal transduction histidine kinase
MVAPEKGESSAELAVAHEQELEERIRLLIELRWAAAPGLAITTALVRHLGVVPTLPEGELYAISAAIFAYNVVFFVLLRARSGLPVQARSHLASVIANLQISLDLAALTLSLHYAGGIENPVAFFYLLHVSFASVLLSRRATLAQCALAILLYSGLILGERYGWLDHYNLRGVVPAELHRHTTFVWGAAAIFAGTVGYIGILATTIVSRLRQREEEILKLTRELQAHAQRLEAAYDQLAGVERAKSAYLRKVSHELRSPLAALQTSLRVVLDGMTGDIPDRARQLLASSEKASGRILHLVEDLLVLSRAREMRPAGEPMPVDANEAVLRVAETERPRAEQNGVALQLELRDGLPPISGELESVHQLLTNLISNAIKYTSTGGQVTVAAVPDGEQMLISVSDTGIGIAPDELPRIFDDFYRAPRAREFKEEGTGLGLPIVKSIVSSHGGRIEVDSQPGKGTTFRVWLPSYGLAGESAPAASREAGSVGRR